MMATTQMKTILLMAVVVCATACGAVAPASTLTPYPTLSGSALGDRPSTPVKIALVSPTNSQVVHGTSVLVKVSVTGGMVTKIISSHVTPTLGIDDLILELLEKRTSGCVEHAFSCDQCRGTLRSGEPGIPIPATSH